MLRRLLGLPPRSAAPHDTGLMSMPRRLEEAIAFFAVRSNPHYHAPTTYLGDHTVLGLLEGRLPIYLDTRGTDLAPHVMMFGMWEPNYTRLFQQLIRPGDTVFDLGAHLGVALGLLELLPLGDAVLAVGHEGGLAKVRQRPLQAADLLARAAQLRLVGGDIHLRRFTLLTTKMMCVEGFGSP